MANEAVIIELLGNKGDPVSFTCSDGAVITKGDLLSLDDNRTVSGVSLTSHAFAGIAAADKVAGDGQTQIACYTNGIFGLYSDGAINIASGVMVEVSGVNVVEIADLAEVEDYGKCVGKALDSVAATTPEVIPVRVLV